MMNLVLGSLVVVLANKARKLEAKNKSLESMNKSLTKDNEVLEALYETQTLITEHYREELKK